MANESGIVVDSNVIVSAALLPRSVPRQVVDTALSTGRILISEATVEELEDVLSRPKFDKYTRVEHRLEFLAALVHDARLTKITVEIRKCRDPKDDKFLELAVSGNATHVVSGDIDLLALHPFRGIAIVTPQDYLLLARKLQG